jgi:glucose dehydrogenase
MRRFFYVAVSASAAALLAVAGHAQAPRGSGSTHDNFGARLTAPPTADWPTNGGSLYNQRYSPLTSINRSSIIIKGVWRARCVSGRRAEFRPRSRSVKAYA